MEEIYDVNGSTMVLLFSTRTAFVAAVALSAPDVQHVLRLGSLGGCGEIDDQERPQETTEHDSKKGTLEKQHKVEIYLILKVGKFNSSCLSTLSNTLSIGTMGGMTVASSMEEI